MKKHILLGTIVIVMITGFFTGYYLYRIKQIKNEGTNTKMQELIEDECTAIGELDLEDRLISTGFKEIKTSPNCFIVLKIYYKKCGHLVEKKEEIKAADVNLTEEELREKFKDWEIQKFTETEIVLYKEVNEFCNEHYLLKDINGNITIFSLDENNNEKTCEETKISTKYLTEEDLEKIKSGIYINSKKELNKTLEDFE